MGFKSVAPSKEFSSTSLPDLAKNVTDLAQWAYYEFNGVQAALNSTEADTVWNSVPPKPRRGTTAYADGTHWNPGSGEGPYYFNGSVWTPEFQTQFGVRVVRLRVITASGTYTPSANLVYAMIEAVGGGGAGGGSLGSTTYYLGAAGGGAGAYTRTMASAAAIGASQSVTIGAGGAAGAAGNVSGGNATNTSVGALCTAQGGFGAGGIAVANGSAAGAGGNATSGFGDSRFNGNNGGGCVYLQFTTAAGALLWCGGRGAPSVWGDGGLPGTPNASNSAVNGQAATGYGSGGGGGASNQIAANSSGGAGAPGLVMITEFCSA